MAKNPAGGRPCDGEAKRARLNVAQLLPASPQCADPAGRQVAHPTETTQQVNRARFLVDHVLLKAGPKANQFVQLLRRKTTTGVFESHGLSFSAGDVDEAARLMGMQESQAANNVARDAPFPQLAGELGGIIRGVIDSSFLARSDGALEVTVRTAAGRPVRVELHDDWREELEENPWMLVQGDTVHIAGSFSAGEECVVLRDRGPAATPNLLVAHPDILLTGTSVAATTECRRKALINDDFGDLGGNRAAFLGSCVHDVIQACVAARDFGKDRLDQSIQEALANARMQLWAMQAPEDQFQWDLRGHVEAARQWAAAQYEPCLAPASAPPLRDGGRGPALEGSRWRMTRMMAAEQSVSSARFGVRGKIDGCVLARPPPGIAGSEGVSQAVALELKTGRMRAEHFGQIAVYRLLVGDLYRENCVAPGALLFYTGDGNCSFHDNSLPILRGVVRNRNHLAAVLQRRRGTEGTNPPAAAAPQWPKPLQQDSVCKRCFSRQACAVAHAVVEGGSAESFGAPEVFKETGAQAISNLRRQYMARWVSMIESEALLMASEQARPWVLDREAQSGGESAASNHRSLTQLRLVRHASLSPAAAEAARREFTAGSSMEGSPCWEFERAGGNLTGGLQLGDGVAVSRTGGPYAFAQGFVEEISAERVRVRVKCDSPSVLQTQLGREMVRSQIADIEDLASGACGSSAWAASGHVYRLDLDAYGGGWRNVRGSLVRLLMHEESQKMAELVVDLRAPRFRELAPGEELVPREVAVRHQSLNVGQRTAVTAAVRAEDFLIISGYPGSGKTETVVALLDTLVARGERVLLCAHTNTAVDNVLLRLRRDVPQLRFARCGLLASIHPDLHDVSVPWGGGKWSSVEQVEAFAAEHRLVACTLTSTLREHLAAAQRFDTVVIEEASQAVESSLWGPLLRCAGRFVLVGDLKQLPPLVRSTKAKEGGMDCSLLERLSLAHPAAVVELCLQYRMNADIASVANELVYEGKLQSSPEASQGRLDVSIAGLAGWAQGALRPDQGVAFADTDAAGQAVKEGCGALENAFEVRVCMRLVQALLRGGLPGRDILLVSPYRQQITKLKAAVRKLPDDGAGDVEVLTVDQAQGRSVRCVLFSCVRNSTAGVSLGELLCDWRRLNVALTRARHKLVVVGSSSTLAGNGGEVLEGRLKLRKLVDICRSKGWVVPVPPEAGMPI